STGEVSAGIGGRYARVLLCHVSEIPKSECRMSKQARMIEVPNDVITAVLEIRISKLFRNSDFEIRICANAPIAARNLCACRLARRPIRSGRWFRLPSLDRADRARSFPNMRDRS